MTTADVQTAIDNALHQLYTRLPNDEPVKLKNPVEILIFDEDQDEVILHNVTHVHKIGVDIYIDSAYYNDEAQEDVLSYEIQHREHEESILDIFQACKQARPDIFEEAKSKFKVTYKPSYILLTDEEGNEQALFFGQRAIFKTEEEARAAAELLTQ